jgi:hypothetical protein
MDDEEKVLAGRPDANFPALLTETVRGGLRGFRIVPASAAALSRLRFSV